MVQLELFEKRKRNPPKNKISPIKAICPETRHRVINQVLFEEFFDNELKWANSSSERLASFGINISPGTIKKIKRDIETGKRNPIAASNFHKDVTGGIPGSRYGKDQFYAQLKVYIDLFLFGQLSYVGLPANQILSVSNQYNNVVACETNNGMYSFMKKLVEGFSIGNTRLINNDIFNFLLTSNDKFDIFDFDLMCNISPEVIENITMGVKKTMKDRAVVAVATSYGRKITEAQHDELMPGILIESFIKCGIGVKSFYHDKYNDRVIPMKYVIMYLKGES